MFNFSLLTFKTVKILNNLLFLDFKRYFVFKTYGRRLYYLYGGYNGKKSDLLKAENEKLYKYGDPVLGIFYYSASFNNMISIFFRITGVIIFILTVIFILMPFFVLYSNSSFFFDFKFIHSKFDLEFFYDFSDHSLPINWILLRLAPVCDEGFFALFLLFVFKYILFIFCFSFLFHVFKKIYILFEFYSSSKTKNSGYNHFRVRGY